MMDQRAGDTENRKEAAEPAYFVRIRHPDRHYQSLDLTWVWRAPLACLETELVRREAAWDGVSQAPELDLWSLRREIAKRVTVKRVCDFLGRLNETR